MSQPDERPEPTRGQKAVLFFGASFIVVVVLLVFMYYYVDNSG